MGIAAIADIVEELGDNIPLLTRMLKCVPTRAITISKKILTTCCLRLILIILILQVKG